MTTSENPTNRPVAEIRDGVLKIAIFTNPKKDGEGVRFSHKLTRSYRDANGNWRETAYLSGSENLRAANLMILAYNKELELKAVAKEAAADNGAEQ